MSDEKRPETETFRLVLGGYDDLAEVYDLMRKQFPRQEIYQIRDFIQMVNKDKYKILLYRRVEDDQLIGYATTYSMPDCKTVWLDLFAVLPEFQYQGYGQKLFDAVFQKYCGMFDGLLLCSERVDPSDPEKAKIQQRRLEFYHKVGAYVLHTDFQLPVESGGFPMYLLFKPNRGIHGLSREDQMRIVRNMFDYCYGHVKHRQALFQQFKDSIVDEIFQVKGKGAHHG
ncbi:MAG: GNAT family N-acetyltransferase [Oscillospiraceae bacterium]|nr:GNAT family N-acetyltransferase [Oscillospiraceae bacterium]